MDAPLIGIKAKDLCRRLILKEGNYRVWSTMTEQILREEKLWNHVVGIAIHPPPPRVVSPAVAAVAAVPSGAVAVAAVGEVTQEMVDADIKKEEGFESAMARANMVILQSIEQNNVMALHNFLTPPTKWTKLLQDYALISN